MRGLVRASGIGSPDSRPDFCATTTRRTRLVACESEGNAKRPRQNVEIARRRISIIAKKLSEGRARYSVVRLDVSTIVKRPLITIHPVRLCNGVSEKHAPPLQRKAHSPCYRELLV